MTNYQDTAISPSGIVVPNAQVAVFNTGLSSKPTIYSDAGITPLTNPFQADAQGRFKFYAANGKYDVQVSGPGIVTQTKSDIEIFDALSSPTFIGNLTGNVTGNLTGSQSGGSIAATTISASGLVSANAGVTVATGQTLSADQVAPRNITNQGGFFGGYVLTPQRLASQLNVTANKVWVMPFRLPQQYQVSFVVVKVTGNSAATTGDVGIYSLAGSKLVSAGGFSTANLGVLSLSFTPVTLNPGPYYFVWTNSSVVPSLLGVSVDDTGLWDIVNASGVGFGHATNNASAGVLPATLGSIVADNQGTAPVALFAL